MDWCNCSVPIAWLSSRNNFSERYLRRPTYKDIKTSNKPLDATNVVGND